MDILRPPIVKIGNRCYRKTENFTPDDSEASDNQDFRQPMEEDLYNDEECEANVDIEETESGYRLRLAIPSAYFKFIIGKKGETKRRLENETGTQIRIPKQGEEGDIVISGHDRKGIISANTRIEVLVESARQKQPFTHFLSISLSAKEMQDKFLEFREDVLRFCQGDRGIDDTIFQNPKKLHLTIGTLALMSDSEIGRAKDVLKSCYSELSELGLTSSPLKGHYKGLEYMNDDPGDVDVLYAKVQLDDGTDRLQKIVDLLVDKFCKASLMQREFDRVKLHVTVMNSLMRQDPSGTTVPQRGQKNRESFDAQNVLKNFGDYEFGVHNISQIQLSQRYSTGPDGYYACAASLNLPR